MPITPESMNEDIKEIKTQLCQILQSLKLLERHDERLLHMEKALNTMWEKHDQRSSIIETVRQHQASCPRDQVKWVWWVLVPQSLALLGMLIAVLHKMGVGK